MSQHHQHEQNAQALSLVPVRHEEDEPPPSPITRSDDPRLLPGDRRILQLAEAGERVRQRVSVPQDRPEELALLVELRNRALELAHGAEQLRGERESIPSREWVAARNAAISQWTLYVEALVARWPVAQWDAALRSVASAAVSEGAWDLAASCAIALENGSESPEWLEAVVECTGRWWSR